MVHIVHMVHMVHLVHMVYMVPMVQKVQMVQGSNSRRLYATPVAGGVQNSLLSMNVADWSLGACSTESCGSPL